MNLSLTDLRPLNGSLAGGFEELVCQLAEAEPVPDGSRFVRIGAPDGGVEAVWILPNGDEWGWQAKFFTSPPGPSQWQQIDGSVETALGKRPRLTRMTICTPLDRSDPRVPNQLWFMDRWDERVNRWKSAAGSRVVEFDYWGQFEIVERLSREENRGRTYFWFNKQVLTREWFDARLQEAVANAGARYTPELNVELPISRAFDGLGRRPEFFRELKRHLRDVRRAHADLEHSTLHDVAPDPADALEAEIARLRDVAGAIPEPAGRIEWEQLRDACNLAVGHVNACIDLVAAERVARRERDAAQSADVRQVAASDPLRSAESKLLALMRRLHDLVEWTHDSSAEAANLGCLLVTGEAGSGKTHLFCDVAARRLAAGAPTVLALGQHFAPGEPWAQLIALLGLTCMRDEFLGAMDAAGEASGSRALILIDALNESRGKTFWSDHLPAMLTAVSRYPWVGIAVSVRSSYEDLLVPSELVPGRLPKVEHTGFADHELRAADAFFDHYGIERPSIPLLRPEFQNPLFLKLFCKGLSAAGYTQMPKGLEGISTIFGFFLRNVNAKLARPEELDFNPKRDLVGDAVRKFAEELARRGADELPEHVAEDLVNAVLPAKSFENSLYRRLLAEGVLAEDRHALYDAASKQFTEVDVVRFGYERLGDFRKAMHLVEAHLDLSDPQGSFAPTAPLGQFVANEVVCYRNRGLIEALSVLLPERIGIELGEAAPHCADFAPVREAFVSSVIWRQPLAVLDSTLEHAKRHALRFQGTAEQFTDAVLSVATIPDHPWNALFLHSVLRGKAMPDRDAWWSVYLHDRFSYHEGNPVQRLVDWAWHGSGQSAISDDAMHLAALALCWFFTSSNRTLRDRATKAAVAMLTPRLSVVARLVDDFADVDDTYVSERVYAVAYGCAMRSRDNRQVGRLAQKVFDRVFRGGRAPVNILARDYARGVIEAAVHRGVAIEGSLELARPPYGSSWPETLLSEEDLTRLKTSASEPPAETGSPSARAIFHSLGKHGDFARYIIGTNHGLFEWLPTRLGVESGPTPTEVHDRFVASLTARQKAAFDTWQILHMLALWDDDLLDELKSIPRSKEEREARAAEALTKFRRSIRGEKRRIFDSAVHRYIEAPHLRGERFDLSLIRRWCLARVFEMGWTEERFGSFDRRVHARDHSQSEHTVERMGKKYQWIAYYEILARVADNFAFRASRSDDSKVGTYVSPAQVSRLRNIDPSSTETSTKAQRWWDTVQQVWWAPKTVDEWHLVMSDAEWLRTSESIPHPHDFLAVTAPSGESWLALNGQYTWREPENDDDLGGDGLKGREVKLWVSSYLVPQEQLSAWREWARRPEITDEHLEGPDELSRVFAGEIPWAPAYQALYPDAAGAVEGYGWDQRYPSAAYQTTQGFSWESGYDASVEDSISLDLPSAFLMGEMPLQWNGQGLYSTEGGIIAAMDPSVMESGPSVLLLHQDTLVEFLRRRKLSLLWIVTGEKNAYGAGVRLRGADEEWHGRTYIRGAYSLGLGDVVEGAYEVEFRTQG